MRNTKTLLAMIVVLAMIVSAAATSFVVSGNEETDEVSTESVESVESSEASAESADSVESSEDAADAVYGDVNADGDINSLDAAQVLRADAQLLTLEAAAILAADVNGDGDVNSLDAAQILKYDAQLITSFPIEEAGEESSEVSADSAESAESAESSDAPVESVESSEAPVESSEAPIESADTPVESSEAPVESSEAPITSEEPSEAPVETSEESVESVESIESSEESVEDSYLTVEDNLLLNKEYTLNFDGTYNKPDDGTLLTNGAIRGDKNNAWSDASAVSGVSVEWFGTGKTIEVVFNFGSATDIDTLVFRNVRIASNRAFGTLIINDTGVFMSTDLAKTEVPGAPLYAAAEGAEPTAQYFDITVPVNLTGVTTLKIQLITDMYCCHFDEIEAYGVTGDAPIVVPGESSEAPAVSEETSEAPVVSEETSEDVAPAGDNLLLNKTYTVTFDGSAVADDGVKATDGKFRGDGESAWNNNLKGDASVEWMGTGKTITYTFTFDEATNVGTIVFKSVRVASNRQFGTLIINDTTFFMSSDVTKTPVADGPLYAETEGAEPAPQFFDISVDVDLNDITELKIQLITDAYCCQYDEVEAYAA